MNRTPKIGITLLLTAIIVGALSLILPKDEEKYMAEYFWTHKTLSNQKYNVVLMGDSRVYRSLSPELMRTHLPDQKILNFAYSNGGLNPTMFKAAEAKLSQKSNQKIIVLGISANTITAYTENNNQYIQEFNIPREEVIERMYFSPVKYWFSPTSPEKLKALYFDEPPTSYYKNKFHLNGYVHSEKFPVDTMEAIPSYIKDFTNYKVDEQKLETLYRQVARWKEKGIVTIGFRPPVSQAMYQLEDTMGHYNEAAIKANLINAGGYWLNLNSTNYNTYDGSHLNESSAIKLSEKLALFIKQTIDKK